MPFSTLTKKAPRNPGFTVLNTVGRTVRDEPHYGYLPIRLYAKRAKVRADSLNDWCQKRYLETRTSSGKALYRIDTYKHADGKRYVNRVFFKALTDDDRVMLKLLFGDFVTEKVERTGALRRPKLKGEEREELDRIIAGYYADITRRRKERVIETGKAY